MFSAQTPPLWSTRAGFTSTEQTTISSTKRSKRSGKNTYEHIKSLVILSTDDMVNYTYHGIIDIAEICPWALASGAVDNFPR